MHKVKERTKEKERIMDPNKENAEIKAIRGTKRTIDRVLTEDKTGAMLREFRKECMGETGIVGIDK